MTETRFDVIYTAHGVTLEPHFCREWDESGGCYGTNPDHGYALDEAREQIARWHEAQAQHWRDGTHHLLISYLPSPPDHPTTLEE